MIVFFYTYWDYLMIFFSFNLLMWSSYINILFSQSDPPQKQTLLQWEAK